MQLFMAKDKKGNVRHVLADSEADAQARFKKMGSSPEYGDIAVKKSKKDCGV